MSVLLVDLCNSSSFNDDQKKFFWKNVLVYFSENPFSQPNDIANSCLTKLWLLYNRDGVSTVRSLRTTILELAIDLLDAYCVKEVEALVAILVAMYHSPEYINSHCWFTNEVSNDNLPVEERVLLSTALIALGSRYVPDITECTDSYILEHINAGKEKKRSFRKAD